MAQLTEIEWQRPRLYPKQHRAVFNPCRFAIIEAGTKTGKTAGCMAWLAEQWATAGAPGRNYWWVAPTYKQAKVPFLRLQRGLPDYLYDASIGGLKLTNRLNGAVMSFHSGEKPDNLYGDDVYAAVIDEATRCRPEVWDAIRSTLTATRGPCRIIGNVKGRKNWVYRLARLAQGGELRGWSYSKITAWDAVRAGVLTRQEILDAKAVLTRSVFRELYLAVPTEDGSNPFGYEFIRGNTLDDDMEAGPVVVWGWDLGRQVDWTVGIGLDANGQVAALERWQRNWPMSMRAIVDITAGLPALVDATGLGDPVVQTLQEVGGDNFEGLVFSPPEKQRLLEGLVLGVQSQQATWNRKHQVLRDELEDFEFVHTRTGIRYEAPPGLHDDTVCALALAYRHLHSPHGSKLIAW